MSSVIVVQPGEGEVLETSLRHVKVDKCCVVLRPRPRDGGSTTPAEGPGNPPSGQTGG
jgi:hypothetical protein